MFSLAYQSCVTQRWLKKTKDRCPFVADVLALVVPALPDCLRTDSQTALDCGSPKVCTSLLDQPATLVLARALWRGAALVCPASPCSTRDANTPLQSPVTMTYASSPSMYVLYHYPVWSCSQLLRRRPQSSTRSRLPQSASCDL